MDFEHKPNLLEAVDARTKLAGSNKMEILLFSLGTDEIFGINVFKVREVTKTPPVTQTPNMPAGVEGVISLRGHIIPVISLGKFFQMNDGSDSTEGTMMVTEYSRRTQGFLVHDVDRIVRVDWDHVKSPDSILSNHEHLVTAITELPDGKLVSIVDVEQILVNAFGENAVPQLTPVADSEATAFFVDDSIVARREISLVLDQLQVKYHQANNGREAWERLQNMAQRAAQDGEPLTRQLSVILVDAEMPEMDGYVLTRSIKADHRFDGIPVVMHSSLSSDANRNMGANVGVDAYVAKFDPQVLADTIRPLLQRH
ncbi:MAG: chemotaxis protein CheV [Betaproteobacteria bacterium]|nr:chemotaxis protein CheV [Betaproteobacteria bacterium]